MFASQVSSDLLEVSDLTCAEENLRLPVAIFVFVFQPVSHDVLARGLNIPVHNFTALTQKPVAIVKVIVAPARWETGGGNSHSLENTASSQLLHNLARFPLERMLIVIGFDTADVMRRCGM